MSGLRCRRIGEADLAAVAALLTRGFPNRTHEFWLRGLAELSGREPPAGFPKYGYLMDCDGRIVGALLLICATLRSAEGETTRCNLSSWFVEPKFRAYAPLLVSQALRHKGATYLNVSPAPHTRPIIEAQGFSRYSDGVFVAAPVLNGWFSAAGAAKVFDAHRQPAHPVDPFEREVLLQHAAHGCISLWCETAEGVHPFVFRPRLAKTVIPCAQLIYCRDLAELVRFAGPIGRHLFRRGRPIVIVDANGPIPGLVGMFRRDNFPKYFKGPQRPRLGDLAYTEYALLGV